MIRLSENDSAIRVEDATERHMRLCAQNRNAEKYSKLVLSNLTDFQAKKVALEKADKEVNAAQDTVWLNDAILDDVLRNLHGRAKEFDRLNPGINVTALLFPGSNITSVITMPDKEEPDAAHSIAQKVISLGNGHVLFSFAAEIEKAVNNCRTALQKQIIVIQAKGNANTALYISKMALVRQYNANYFAAAGDVDKSFAEKLFPQLRSKKKKDETGTTEEAIAA